MAISEKKFKIIDFFSNIISKQIETNRKEAADVKSCFTTQVHQTLIASAAILTLGVNLMINNPFRCYFLILASILTIILCQATAHVGCHKFNTANRTTAYEIHLSRIMDYDQYNNKSKSILASELLKIDWEEAMFAWRLVQPIIYKFFYIEKLFIGTCFVRFKLPKFLLNRRYKEFKDGIKEYPWYDSRKIIEKYNKEKTAEIPALFYPGTYLRRMLKKLFVISFVSLIIYLIASLKIIKDFNKYIDAIQPLMYNFKIDDAVIFFIHISLMSFFPLYTLLSIFNCWWRCLILESGLLSIQTSGFVWRIVCISLLTAKIDAIKNNLSSSQIFKGYTLQLAKVASNDLFKNLHRIHEWLGEKEKYIIKEMKILYKFKR